VSLVTCVGLAVQDLVFTMGEPVIAGEKNFASDLRAVGGGPAANAAVAVAMLGGAARLISAVGVDGIGDEIVRELAGFGVDTTRIRRVEAPSAMSAVLVASDGDRTIINRTDPALWSSASLPSRDDLEGSTAVLVDVRWMEGALAAVGIAHDLDIPAVVDCDLTDAPVPDELLHRATHVVFSEPAFSRARGAVTGTAVEALARSIGGVVAVTRGSEGVLWSDGGPSSHTDAVRVTVVDTLGAGDVFHGAFALGVAGGGAIADIVRWSSVAAALKCAHGGGRFGFPTLSEVEAHMEESTPWR
jgi:sulfofructose kinase